MRKITRDEDNFGDDTFPQEIGRRPKRTVVHSNKKPSNREINPDHLDDVQQYRNRRDPAKSIVRVQLRRIQRLF